MTHKLIKRQRTVEAVAKKFVDRRRKYGEVDCVRLSALALRKGGHTIPALRNQRYKSIKGARDALHSAGYSTLIEAVDDMGLAEIAPLSTLPGDLIAMPVPDDDPFGASLMVVHTAGAKRVIGFDGDGSIRVVVPDLSACLKAWRV
jgi:phosphomannomutase